MHKSRLHEGTFHSWQSPRHCKELEAVLWPKLIAIRSLEMTMSLHLSTKNFFTTQQGTVTSESCIWELLGTWPTGAEISKNPMKSTSSIRTISVWARIQLSQVPRKSLSIACHMCQGSCEMNAMKSNFNKGRFFASKQSRVFQKPTSQFL